MSDQNIIFYEAGCYGTFFEWLVNFLENPNTALPFNMNGSSHKFKGNLWLPPKKLFDHVDSGQQFRFGRTHPGLFEKPNEHENCFKDSYDNVLQEDLTFLKKHFDKILCLTYDHQSVLWFENNTFDKVLITEQYFEEDFKIYGYTKEFLRNVMSDDAVERIKHTIDLEINSASSTFTVKNLQGWNKNNIYDFDIWELRELLSLYWFTKSDGQIHAWTKLKSTNNDILFISITELKKDFTKTVLNVAQHFDIKLNNSWTDRLEEIKQQWLPLQRQIDKDSTCNRIVQALYTKEFLDWSDISLSIIDEAWIQKELFKRNIGIKCDKLNIFPKNTNEFELLLEDVR